MADPSAVNTQITDAVTQANAKVLNKDAASAETTAGAGATPKIAQSDTPDTLLALLTALRATLTGLFKRRR